PYVIAAKTNVDFRVRFKPPAFGSYSATLEINDISVFVLGEAAASATFSIEDSGAFKTLQTDEPIVFGRVERGKTLPRRCRLANPGTTDLTVSTLTVGQGPFDASGVPHTPLTLKPGGSTDFLITYSPTMAGIHRVNLQVDQRQFVLEAVAFDPAF